MVYLLRDEDYFAVEDDEIGRTSSNILFWAYGIAIIYSAIGGWVYDRFLRKWPITVATVLGALLLAVIPLTCPSLALLTVVRVLIMIAGTQVNLSPLVADYIEEDSVGKAISVQTLGIVLGGLFYTLVLLQVGKQETLTQTEIYAIDSAIMLVLAIPFYFIVRDVKISSDPSSSQD